MKPPFSYQLVGPNVASNQESAQRFKETQREWIAFSEKTINDAIELLPSLTNEKHPIRQVQYCFGEPENHPPILICEAELTPTKFGKLLLFFAKRRAEVAQKLEHGKDNVDQLKRKGRTEEYGDIRFYSQRFSSNRMVEVVSLEGETNWASQSKVIFETINNLLNVDYEQNEDEPFVHYRTDDAPYYITSQYNDNKELRLKMIFHYMLPPEIKLSVKSYSDDTISFVMHASVDPQTNKPKPNIIQIEYIELDRNRLPGDMEIANYYLEKMLTWQPSDGVDAFMLSAGHLAQHSICLLPCRLGSAGVIEWMLRSVAYSRGIVLGDFNQGNGISWDFKALVTVDRNAYAEWFATQAFSSVILIPSAVSAPLIQSAVKPSQNQLHSDPVNFKL